MDIYSSRQVEKIFECVSSEVEWFLLGGPADGDEAQIFHERFPLAKIIGFEPNSNLRSHQEARGFPGLLLDNALWNEDADLYLHTPPWADRCSSVQAAPSKLPIRARSLDSLSREYGPFNKAVLWIDIEGAEMKALEGATGLLSSGAIWIINVEDHIAGDTLTEPWPSEFGKYLARFGYYELKRWNGQVYGAGIRWDLVFARGG